MKRFISLSSALQFILAMIISLSVHAAQEKKIPVNLDDLLKQVQREGVLEQQQNKLREARFLAARDGQARLLQEARDQLAFEQQRTEQLNTTFHDFERSLAEKEALLKDKSGSLGELFGTVRQVSNETRSVLESSMVTVQKPARVTFLKRLADSKQQPTISDLRQLWLTIQEEMTESGKVSQFKAPVISAQGKVKEQKVTRVGVFTAFSEGKFLRYLPETGDLVELGRQPVERLRKIVSQFEQKQDGSLQPVVVDPTRGALLALLVQSPNLEERIKQGGWIGYLILGIGVIALLIALQRFIYLTWIGRSINLQRKSKTISKKNPLGRILSVYQEAASHDVETLSLKLDEAILREVPKVERGLITLAVLAAIAPMLGLLGTVSGMIETFQSITLFGTGDPKLMSSGISQALVTTELGLAVAIPLLLIHSLLSSKSNRLVHILDEESAALVAKNAEAHHGSTGK